MGPRRSRDYVMDCQSNYISKNPITKLIGLYSNSIKIITKWICIYFPKRGVKEVHKKSFEPCKKD